VTLPTAAKSKRTNEGNIPVEMRPNEGPFWGYLIFLALSEKSDKSARFLVVWAQNDMLECVFQKSPKCQNEDRFTFRVRK